MLCKINNLQAKWCETFFVGCYRNSISFLEPTAYNLSAFNSMNVLFACIEI